MDNDLISIIVPVYNVEKYLERCLKSIENQTYTNWELILVNDGSTDDSGKICQNFAVKDNRIIYMDQQNQGQSVARNRALDIAKGKYICFIDSDDWVDLNYLKFLYEAIYNFDSDIAICGYYISSDYENIVNLVHTNKSIFKVNEFKTLLVTDKIKSFLVNKIFKKEIIGSCRFIPGIYYEDYCFYNEILPNIKKDIPVVNKPLYYYYQRIDSTTHLNDLKHVLDWFNAVKSRYELNYINFEEKIYCLKNLLLCYLQLVKLEDFDYKIIYNSKHYIISTNNIIFVKAKKLLPKRLLLNFLLSFYFPALYKNIFKFYKINIFNKNGIINEIYKKYIKKLFIHF